MIAAKGTFRDDQTKGAGMRRAGFVAVLLCCLMLPVSGLTQDKGRTEASSSNDAIIKRTRLVSSNSSGVHGNKNSSGPSISLDGRYVAFWSASSNLVLRDANSNWDVFVKDLVTGKTRIASVDQRGAQGNNYSGPPVISLDGKHVAFVSAATNLVPGALKSVKAAYVKNLETGSIQLASADSNGLQANANSIWVGISSDGRYVVFETAATNFGINTGHVQVYVKDTRSNHLSLVSSTPHGLPGDNDSVGPSVSADGRYVSFTSNASNFANNPIDTYQVYVKDMFTGAVFCASSNVANSIGNNSSGYAGLSSDGHHVAFPSFATNLTENKPSNFVNVYVKNLITGAVVNASSNKGGISGDGNSFGLGPSISADGRYVAFFSDAKNLVPGDNNKSTDVFVKDVISGDIARVSISDSGVQGNGNSTGAVVSSDGRYIAFASSASNLVPGDNNHKVDVFISANKLYK